MRAIQFYDHSLWWGSLYQDKSFCLHRRIHIVVSYETNKYDMRTTTRVFDVLPCDGSCRRPGPHRNVWRKVVLPRSIARRIR